MAGETPDMVLDRLLANRFSCRAYRPDAVPEATIRRILSIAQRTATWCNTQPWQVTVTMPPATERLRKLLHARAAQGIDEESDLGWPREYRGVYLQRRRETGFALYEAVGIAKGDMAGRERQTLENFRLFGAPHLALITSDEALGPYGALDCGAYVANFLNAAEACGVAAIPQAALARHSGFLRGHFGLGDDRMVICGISFGFADRDAPVNGFRTTRAPIEDAVTFVAE
ncbi:nitroreductase [Phreatobacter sp. AB_2022a]|uniref:nitroreductase n=1 Tax=Phreatobacter sp. AB_2022a TaxID=3003134 RepID=UPI0022872AB2|nr:nitroreductase [Phreatobacter sp. AB_2022a]MCZ0735891.1 nitroreductase [Phreatobacter sp. AB_2022a]